MQHANDFVVLCEDAKTRIKEISTDELEALQQADKIDYLIDVREADEYHYGHMPNAHHISKGWIEAQIHKLVDHKERTVVLYCGGGNRSALAADNLQKMGYKNILSLRGGYKGWLATKGYMAR